MRRLLAVRSFATQRRRTSMGLRQEVVRTEDFSKAHNLNQPSNSVHFMLGRGNFTHIKDPGWDLGLDNNAQALSSTVHQPTTPCPTLETAGMGRWMPTLSETSYVLEWMEAQGWKSYLFWKKKKKKKNKERLEDTKLCCCDNTNSYISQFQCGFWIHKKREESQRMRDWVRTEGEKPPARILICSLVWGAKAFFHPQGSRGRQSTELGWGLCLIPYGKCHMHAASLSSLLALISTPPVPKQPN